MNFARLGLNVLASTIAASSFAQIVPHARVHPNANGPSSLSQTWVSGAGNDTNPCTRAQPCATFAAALALTNVGGEIAAVDAGDFGSVIINQAVTINGAGGSITAASGSGATPAITIAAGASDAVTLRNLDISGLGQSTSNGTGITISSAKTVHLENVRVTGFSGAGILVQTAASTTVTVNDSVSSDNLYGIAAQSSAGTAFILVTRSHFAQENIGIFAAPGSKFMVSDSDVVRGQVGYEATGASMDLVRSKAVDESTAGIQADQGGVIRLSETTIANNTTAAKEVGNGIVVSFGNNAFTGGLNLAATIPLK